MLNSQHTNPPSYPKFQSNMVTDYGPNPFITDIGNATVNDNAFRTALWTGNNLQLILMDIPVGGEIGIEVHPDNDQFLHIESGHGVVRMGNQMGRLNFQRPVFIDSAIFIPARVWHNIVSTSDIPLKLYSIYAPPHHPWGTIYQTKAIAEANANHY